MSNSDVKTSHGALRSTFGFDRADEGWLGVVREATAAPAELGMLGPYTVLAEIGAAQERGVQGDAARDAAGDRDQAAGRGAFRGRSAPWRGSSVR